MLNYIHRRQLNLEPHTSLEVNDPRASGRGSDSTEASRVERGNAIRPVRVIPDIYYRCLKFQTYTLTYREALDDTHVHVEERSRVDAVQREIPKGSGVGLPDQSRLKRRRRDVAARAGRNIQQFRIEPENTRRGPVDTDILPEFLKRHTE